MLDLFVSSSGFQVNDYVVKDFDCCRIVPLLSEIEGEVMLIVARNPLAGSV